MTAPVAWSDPTATAALRADARSGDVAGLRKVAQQFESLFLRMMLKSMREASAGDPLFDSNEGGLYRDMFDDQIAVDMSEKGSMGLADLLVKQLSRLTPGERATGADHAVGGASEADRGAFVRKMWPLASAAGRALGIDPRHIVAQAALETGWGKAAPGDNHFGIKAGAAWQGDRVRLTTTEYANGTAQSVGAEFRAYASAADSVRDYARLLGQSPRYATVRDTGSDIDAFGRALQTAGYATDPNYAAKLRAVANQVDELLPQFNSDAALKLGSDAPITGSQTTW